MCVAISLDPGAELSLDEVEKMNRSNADGVGVAWAREGVVYWYKTIKVNPHYIQKMVAHWKDQPRLVHFRLSTAGGVHAELCHPFEIGPEANCNPVGKGSRVMIHNGHWQRWNDVADILRKEQALPRGPWSDTRLAAMLAYQDPDWLETVDGKVAVMTGEGETTLLGTGWEKLRDGIWVSNTHWNHTFHYSRSGKDRYWEGWGRDEWEWEEKERHEQEKARARAVEEFKASQAEKRKGLGVGGVGDDHGGSESARKEPSSAGPVVHNGRGVAGAGVSTPPTPIDYNRAYWTDGAGSRISREGHAALLRIEILDSAGMEARKKGICAFSIVRGANEWSWNNAPFRSQYTGQFFHVIRGTNGKLGYLYPHEALRLLESPTSTPPVHGLREKGHSTLPRLPEGETAPGEVVQPEASPSALEITEIGGEG